MLLRRVDRTLCHQALKKKKCLTSLSLRAFYTFTSPLEAFKKFHQSGSSCRTGYTHLFSGLSDTIDRSPAQDLRRTIRAGEFQGQTSGRTPGFVQANFVALPKEFAFDFLSFCLRNPKSCPLLAVTDPGDPCPRNLAPGSDVRTDIPKYRVWRDGLLSEEIEDVQHLWSDDMVGFLLGCSFSWEHALEEAGYIPRHVAHGSTVPMYRTNVPNLQAGAFGGHLVVSMRPYKRNQIQHVAELTGCYAGAHGSPVHWGDSELLGIDRQTLLASPDWGDSVSVEKDDVPVFWACGVTPHTAIMDAKLPLVLTHSPGHMFVCDITNDELRVETKMEESWGS
jgi:uncharacterized protein YcsI (UPF0317 family)